MAGEQLGEAVLVLRTDDQGLERGIDSAKPKAEALGRTLDDTSGSAANLGKALDTAGNSATQFGEKQGQVTKMTGAQRAGIQQLSANLGDMSTMYSMGMRPAQIFSTQIGQITQAIQLTAGEGSKFAAFLGGPWGVALTIAAQVGGPLIAMLLDSKSATDKASKGAETFADSLDRQKHSLKAVSYTHLKRAAGIRTVFLSIEPLVGPVTIPLELLRQIDWVIVGGESGKHARPMHPDWVRALRDACAEAGVPFFFKQWGDWLPWEPEHVPGWKSQNGGWLDGNTLPDFNDADLTDWTDACLYDGDDVCCHQRVGKHAAGRLLDGVLHNDRPEALAHGR